MRPIFVKKLKKKERVEIKRLLGTTNTRLYKRVRVIWLSSQHFKALKIAEIVDLHLNKVRKYIRRFNKEGIRGLYQKPSPGRPIEIKVKQRKQIIKLVKSKPQRYGLAWTNWSLRGLCDVAIKGKMVSHISPEYMRQIVSSGGYSYKKSKEWITSPDPEYEVKKTPLKKHWGRWTKEEK